MRTVEKSLYQFAELSDSAKEKARAWWRQCEDTDFDAEFVFADAVECGRLIGIEIDTRAVKLMGGGARYKPTIYYSGFSCQGDGACFEGRYSYAKGSCKAIRAHCNDAKLIQIADDLYAIQRRAFYKLEAQMRHSGRYCHSGCMRVDVGHGWGKKSAAFDDDITQCMRDFADWIYSQLESEYQYRMSDEQVDESITLNEYEFDEDGNRTNG